MKTADSTDLEEPTRNYHIDTGRPVSILTVNNLFEYNGREMDEWQPLFDMLKETNATISEARRDSKLDDYDVIFWDACRPNNSLIFPRVKNLIRDGKIIILTGTNSCRDGRTNKNSSELANEVLRDFGMTLTMDDPKQNLVATSTAKHRIMAGVDSFLVFRSPYVLISDPAKVLPLALSGENTVLAVYEDTDSKGLLVGTGIGGSFLYGVHVVSSKSRDFKCLQIMRNIIVYARSLRLKR